jgi:hypothetical protein
MILFPGDETLSRRVAIVEDEGILALDIERHLKSKGFEVCGVAADSDSAIALVDKERPDLVLMDIRIQGPRDGVETATTLRERFDVPIVYLTAHSDPRTIERAQRTAPMGYLVKPFKKPDLDNVVQIALTRSTYERKLKRREEVLSTTLACLDEAVLTIDRLGVITWANSAAARLCGQSMAALVSQKLAAVLQLRAADGTDLTATLADAASNPPRRLDSTMHTAHGVRTVVGAVAPLSIGAEPFGAVVALRDVTELLEARRQLEFSERLSALGTLAAGVAHELNNPLSVVLSNLEFVLTDELDAALREPLLEARDASHRVTRIVSDLRSFSKPQVEQLSTANPAGALGAALSFTRPHWRRLANVRLRLGRVPPVLGAHTRLTQIFVNLIMNATQAMESVRGQAHELVLTTGTDAAGRAVLSVADTGPGVPAALRERIFEPFVTTKPVGLGTGLGLAVSRNIAETHGGTLELVDVQRPLGTQFSLVLPPGAKATPPASLRVAWVGPPRAELAALESLGQCRVFDAAAPREAFSELSPELVVVATNRFEFGDVAPLTAFLDVAPTPAGEVVLEPGFDAAALAALVTRDRARS